MSDKKISDDSLTGLVSLVILAITAGAMLGLVGGAFRWSLNQMAKLQELLLNWAHSLGSFGWIVPVLVVAFSAGVAALIARVVPLASGSGIQHVEAVLRGESTPPTFGVVPAKFFGGILAIGSGLVLGREGPTVHMGAAIGTFTGRVLKRTKEDLVTLQTSLAGAGLAVAFNAPVGGALFVFEEVSKKFTLRAVITTACSVSVAVTVSWIIIGSQTDFLVAPQKYLPLPSLLLMVVFGVLTGILGLLYNWLVIGSLKFVDTLRKIPRELTAMIIGALIGFTLFLNPDFAGDGDPLTQSILSGQKIALPLLIIYLVIRFFAGPASYAAGTPGGLFAPLLTVGAIWGILFAAATAFLYPHEEVGVSYAIVGMAAFFAATVRAPFTGAVIVMEMTAITAVAVPIFLASGAAVLTAYLLRSAPIYDDLRERMLAAQKSKES